MRTRPAARTTVPCRMIASTAVTATGTATSTPVPEPSMSRFRNCGRAPCRTSAERSRSRAAAQGEGHVGSDRSCPRRRRPSPRAGRLGARATAARQGLRGPGRVVPASRPGGRRVRPDPRHRHGGGSPPPSNLTTRPPRSAKTAMAASAVRSEIFALGRRARYAAEKHASPQETEEQANVGSSSSVKGAVG